MLTINHLTASHNGQHFLKIGALNVKPGEIIAIVGPNGAGKTTLLNSLATPASHTQNDVELHQKPIHLWPRLERAQHLAVLPQHHQLSFPFTVSEVVAMGATPLKLSSNELESETKKWLSFTDSQRFTSQFYPRLSGGEKQRVHLARTLLQLSQAKSAPLLLLDEPTSAQDLGQQHTILSKLKQLCKQRNMMIIMILHDLNLVSRYCDKVWLLQQGTLMAEGAPKHILTPQTIETIWGYRPQQLVAESGEPVLF